MFDCLLIIGKSGEWVKMMVEANKLSDKDVGRVTMLGHQLFIVGLLVYETCVKYIEQQVGKKIGNFGTIELENLPMPMSDMDFEDDEDIATKQLKKKTAN